MSESTSNSLADVLGVDLQHGGVVCVSTLDDPLANTLFLTLRNTSDAPIYQGSRMWSGDPRVIVSFVYGSTRGALAQDDDRSAPATGSAWNILASVKSQEGTPWRAGPPSTLGDGTDPVWILRPTRNNLKILGTDAHAAIVFEFNPVISLTPPGVTQMTLTFLDFPKDENTNYDHWTKRLEIDKIPTPTRGAINFFNATPSVSVWGPNDVVELSPSWTMFQVDRATLSWNEATLQQFNYQTPSGLPPPMNYDHAVVHIPYQQILAVGENPSDTINLYLYTYDGNTKPGLLNAQTFPVSVNGQWGVLSAGAVPPSVDVLDPQQTLSFTLHWNMFEVAHASVTWSAAGSTPQTIVPTRDYAEPRLSTSDSATVSIPYSSITAAAGNPAQGTVDFTVNSFDLQFRPLRSATCTAAIRALFFHDPRDGKSYPVIRVNNTLWMTHNLDWDSGDGRSYFFNHDASLETVYGRLYEESAAKSVPAGWRLPTPSDWQELIHTFGGGVNGANAYPKLIAGGSSGFNARLGGALFPPLWFYKGGFDQLGSQGTYWGPGKIPWMRGFDPRAFVIFVAVSAPPAVMPGVGFFARTAMSVRYVKDL